jgi:hypothetical protein
MPSEDRDRAIVVVERLAADGFNARMPYPRALSDGLFELRFALRTTARHTTDRFTGVIALLAGQTDPSPAG